MISQTIVRLLTFFLLITLSTQALNQAADAAIRQAIKQAVLDGLNVVENFTRNTYWYYLDGSQRQFFNVSILPDLLNYIVVYKVKGAYYRVNCNLDKVTWKPLVNSFVKIQGKTNLNTLATISLVDSSNNSVDLTKQISLSSANVDPVQKSPKDLNTVPFEVIQPVSPANGGIVVLSNDAKPPSPPNLTSKSKP